MLIVIEVSPIIFSGPDLKFKKILRANKLGLDARKPVFAGLANNTGADQPAHPRHLISTFVIRFLESFICRHDSGEISIF